MIFNDRICLKLEILSVFLWIWEKKKEFYDQFIEVLGVNLSFSHSP